MSLILFDEDTCNIKTWWITEDKFALLSAAMGTPEADSLYSREYFNNSADTVLEKGAHFYEPEPNDS